MIWVANHSLLSGLNLKRVCVTIYSYNSTLHKEDMELSDITPAHISGRPRTPDPQPLHQVPWWDRSRLPEINTKSWWLTPSTLHWSEEPTPETGDTRTVKDLSGLTLQRRHGQTGRWEEKATWRKYKSSNMGLEHGCIVWLGDVIVTCDFERDTTCILF